MPLPSWEGLFFASLLRHFGAALPVSLYGLPPESALSPESASNQYDLRAVMAQITMLSLTIAQKKQHAVRTYALGIG